MELKKLLEQLENSNHFKTFKSQNPDTFFSTAFLLLDLTNPQTNEINLDFFLPKSNQLAGFTHPFQSEPKIYPDKIENAKLQPAQINLDINDLETKVNETIQTNNSKVKPTKIIAILKDNTWNLTAMDNALSIIRIKINAQTSELIRFDKGGLMDFIGIQKK